MTRDRTHLAGAERLPPDLPAGHFGAGPRIDFVVRAIGQITADKTGWCRACAAMTFALICSNWAFRSGCFEPSSALRLDWRENPSFTNSLRTVSALIGCPISVKLAASFAMLFDTQIKDRMGSPSVAGATRRSRAGTKRCENQYP